jgi:SPP1 gp7 family putative phage head morphogenesis protein
MPRKLSYWERRFLQTQVNMQRHSANYEAGMVSRLDAAYKSANDDLQKWYARYAKTDGTMDITDAQALMSGMSAKTWQMTLDEFRAKAIEGGHDRELDLEYIKSRVSRLQALQFQMQQHMAEFNDQESPKFQDALASQFDDTYMRTNYNIQMARQQIAANFQTYNEKELAIVVNKPWVGSNFSKRLWKNTVNDLPELLVNNLSQSITLGYSYARIEREMRGQLQDFSQHVIHRLVISEMAHISEEATAQSYKEMDVQEYTYLATLESHTCEVCRKLDGNHYKTADRNPGDNYPPIHAYCRCTTVPYEPALESLPSRRWAKDPGTGKRELIDNTSFEDWKKNGYKANTPKPEKRNYRDFDQAGLDANTDYIQKLPENQRDNQRN